MRVFLGLKLPRSLRMAIVVSHPSPEKSEGWGNDSLPWARKFGRGYAAYFVSQKMGGQVFVGLKPHAPSVWWGGLRLG
jgi:hypothetical protein